MGKEVVEKDNLPEYWERKGVNSFDFYVCNENMEEWT